jgi:hypothetical protein
MQLPTSFHMQGWPHVPLHSTVYDALRVLVMMLYALHRSEPLHLSVRQTAHFCEIALTGANLHFRPEMWDTLFSQPDSIPFEILRSIGAEIEPLTWNEGYGEGIIVRLPWVK